jgi:hypothetical protein
MFVAENAASVAPCHDPSHYGRHARRMFDRSGNQGEEMRFAAVIGAAMIGLLAASSEGMAQHKMIADCQKEWQANKAANLARGVTERAYVDQCRAGGAAIARAATFVASHPAPIAASALSSSPPAAVSERPANKILCE